MKQKSNDIQILFRQMNALENEVAALRKKVLTYEARHQVMKDKIIEYQEEFLKTKSEWNSFKNSPGDVVTRAFTAHDPPLNIEFEKPRNDGLV
jgi:carbamoylphosphate synthase large subunit